MKRDELLEYLQHVNIGVELTVLSSEMALECEYVTSQGYGSCWLSYDAWPAVEIQNISPEKFTELQEKLKVRNLMITDLEGTQLLDFYEANVSEDADTGDLNTFFAPFLDLDKPENGIIYAIVINIDVYIYNKYKEYERPRFYRSVF